MSAETKRLRAANQQLSRNLQACQIEIRKLERSLETALNKVALYKSAMDAAAHRVEELNAKYGIIED